MENIMAKTKKATIAVLPVSESDFHILFNSKKARIVQNLVDLA